MDEIIKSVKPTLDSIAGTSCDDADAKQAVNGAVNKIVSKYGQKPKEALQAALNVFCPKNGELIAGSYIDASGDIVNAAGALHEAFEEEGFSCDEAKQHVEDDKKLAWAVSEWGQDGADAVLAIFDVYCPRQSGEINSGSGTKKPGSNASTTKKPGSNASTTKKPGSNNLVTNKPSGAEQIMPSLWVLLLIFIIHKFSK